MKLEDIQDEWGRDCRIDRSELGAESLRTPELHHKYFKLLSAERLRLRALEEDQKRLRREKHELYSQGPSKEQAAAGARLPPKGVVLKSEVPMYVESDEDVSAMALRIALQKEKLEFLESVVKTIANRNFMIKNAIDWERFVSGG